LNDQELIKQIEDLRTKATIAENSGNENDQRIHLEQMFILYGQLSPQSKKTMQNSLYISHRDLGRLYFILNKCEEAISHLEKAKKLPEYQNEESLIKFLMDHFIVSSRIKMYLKTDSKLYLKNVRDLNNSLLNKVDKIESQDLKNEINYNKSLLQGIDRGGKIKTEIWFEIPPALPLQEDSPITFKFNGVDHILEVEIIKNPSAFIESQGSYVEIVEDKYGLINRSKIKLTIFKYIDPDERVEIKTFSEKKAQFKILLEPLNALNYFIEHYRITTGNYWIEPVFYKMIRNFTFENMFENQEYHVQRSIMDHLTRVSHNIPWLKDVEVYDLKESLDKKENQLWEVLLLDAKDYLLKRSYREAIYAINGAFENYFMLKAQDMLSKAWGKENAMEYLKGKPVYEYHKLKSYMDEETFNRAVKESKITSYVPSTYQILKECHTIYPFAITRKELNELVNKIRKNRNEVMHGVKINDDLETVAFEAIKSFEDFVKLF
jgi:hypothetical protein